MESMRSSANSMIDNETRMKLQTQLSELVCPVCYEYMQPPIMQCSKGHGICNLCHELLSECPMCQGALINRRSSHLESISSTVRYPCVKCTKKFSISNLNTHGCSPENNTKISCLIGHTFGTCSWTGDISELLQHCKMTHPDNFWTQCENTVQWQLKELRSMGIQKIFLLHLKNAFFIIVQKFNTDTNRLQWNVSCECQLNYQFVYEIEIFSDQISEILMCRSEINNEQNILMNLPDENTTSVPVNKISKFLNNDACLYYKIKVRRRSDVEGDVNIIVEDDTKSFKLNIEEQEDQQMQEKRKKIFKICKPCPSIFEFYTYIKKIILCDHNTNT